MLLELLLESGAMATVAQIEFTDYEASIFKALDRIGAKEKLPQKGLIVLKPNLTNASPPPVTTPVGVTEAVYKYCARYSQANIAIGEGCGSGRTTDVFDATGYTALSRKYGLRLIDFNQEKAVRLKLKTAFQWKELYVPEVTLDAFIISLPVLKDHSFTVTTIAMKNMFGIAPAPYYCGSWNKSKLHQPSTHLSVVDVCRYKKPALSVVDASVALTGMHLSGTPKKLKWILASVDPVAVDTVGSRLLGHDPHKIEYLVKANGLLGAMDPIELALENH